MNPLLIYTAGGALLLGLFAGWTVRDWKADGDLAAEAKRQEVARERAQAKVNTSAAQYEALREQIEPARVEVRTNIREIYRDVKVPTECAAPDTVVGLLDTTRRNADSAASGEPRVELPAPAGGATAPR